MRISIHSVVKHAVYSIIMLLIIVAQCAFLGGVEIFGARPQIVLLYVCALAIFEGPRTGAIYGLAGGYLLDIMCGGGIYFSAVIYMIMCYIAAYAVEMFLSDGYVSYIAISAVFLIAKHILDTFVLVATYKGIKFGSVLVSVFLPEFVYTLAVSAVIYFPMMLLCSKFNEDRM